jgi:hypothetical protein
VSLRITSPGTIEEIAGKITVYLFILGFHVLGSTLSTFLWVVYR